MVDQLWLWIFAPAVGHATVFTSFPAKEKEAEDDATFQIADLKQAAYNEASEAAYTGPYEFAATVIRNAIKSMFQVRNDPTLDFLELFREAISQAVSFLLYCKDMPVVLEKLTWRASRPKNKPSSFVISRATWPKLIRGRLYVKSSKRSISSWRWRTSLTN